MAAITQFSFMISHQIASICHSSLPRILKQSAKKITQSQKKSKFAVKLSLEAEQSIQKSKIDLQKLVDFLYEDSAHIFDDQGIDPTAYDEHMMFRDPITKHDTFAGYLFNISLLKQLFRPDFQLHWAKQTGSYEIATRWTVVMRFILLPWKPELVFTGTSVFRVNPETGKFCSHVDCWDSIKENEYFSLEGLWDVFRQLRVYKTPDLETPNYQILKRTADYEVRNYDPFTVAESQVEDGFDSIASLSDQNQEAISLRRAEGGIAAAVVFRGKSTEDVVREKERQLRDTLIRDGLRPREACLLVRYNYPDLSLEFIMRNEVLIWLEDFDLV